MKNKLFILVISLSTFFLFFNVASADITTGLIGHWTFDGKDTNWRTNITLDKSGQGNNGILTTMSTSTVPVSGKIGQGFKLDGVDDSVITAASSVAPPCSASLWINLRQRTNSGLISEGDFNQNGLRSDYFGLGVQVVFGFNNYAYTPQYLLPLNTWTHLVFVMTSATESTLYANGVQVGTITGGSNFTCPRYEIGSNDDLYCLCSLDDIRIYNRVLSASEISQLYKLGSSKVAVSPTDPLKNGLVGYWTFDGKDTNWNTNTTLDKSGNGNTGTLVNMSTTTSSVPGKFGQGLRFDGLNDFVRINTSGTLSGTFTISVWVKPSVSGDTGSFIGSRSPSENSFDAKISFLGAVVHGDIGNGTSWITVAADAPFVHKINNWYNIVYVVTPTGYTIYVDGKNIGSNTYASDIPLLYDATHTLVIGNYAEEGFEPFNGVIDDVRVYNRALSASNITQLYKLGSSKVAVSTIDPLKNGLVGYWPLDGKNINWSSNTATDLSGQGNTASLVLVSTTTSPKSGKIGQGINFTADSGQSLRIGSSPSLANDFTLAGWFFVKESFNEADFFTNYNNSNNYAAFFDNGTNLIFRINNGANTNLSTTRLLDRGLNKWYFLVATRNATTGLLEIYVNSVFQNSTTGPTGTLTYSSGQLAVGGFTNTPETGTCRCIIDEIRIYNRVLKQDEVTKLYKLGSNINR